MGAMVGQWPMIELDLVVHARLRLKLLLHKAGLFEFVFGRNLVIRLTYGH